MKKVITIIAFAMFIIWVIVTAYYYNQHQVIIQRHIVNEKVELNGLTVFINEIVLKDVEPKTTFYSWRYQLLAKIPPTLHHPYIRLTQFYSKPYQEHYNSDRYAFIETRGHVIYDKQQIDHTKLLDYLSISVIDESKSHYQNSAGTLYNEDENIIYTEIRGQFFEKSNSKVDIIITDNSSNCTEVIPVNLNWQTEKYNYFKKEPSRFNELLQY